jgi:glycosyltransferase involved in cell wall biosynthesis
MTQTFTLVSTVFNEQRRLKETINDIENQTVKPTEIIITDAGSSDGTYETLQAWAQSSSIDIHILQKKKCNVAAGRNFAIQHSKYDLIVSTDFGCRFHREWLASIVQPFADSSVKVVGGGFSVLEDKIRTPAARANYILTNGYNVQVDENFIPSSRSIAYYKNVWSEIGGYCEWLTLAADDLVFGKAIRTKGFKIHTVDKPYVYWGRHEETKGYAKEAFRYGLGDGEARVNQRNAISNAVELTLRYLLFTTVILALVNFLIPFVPSWIFLIAILLIPGLRSYIAAFKNWMRLRSGKYNFQIFLISLWLVELTRINYLKGYIKGFFYSTEDVKKRARELGFILQ